jgi:hypothetical protein
LLHPCPSSFVTSITPPRPIHPLSPSVPYFSASGMKSVHHILIYLCRYTYIKGVLTGPGIEILGDGSRYLRCALFLLLGLRSWGPFFLFCPCHIFCRDFSSLCKSHNQAHSSLCRYEGDYVNGDMRGYGQCVYHHRRTYVRNCELLHSTHARRYTFPVNPEFNKASVYVSAPLPLPSLPCRLIFHSLLVRLVRAQLPWLLDQLQARWPRHTNERQWQHRPGHVSWEKRGGFRASVAGVTAIHNF